jgi:hypothetical protein
MKPMASNGPPAVPRHSSTVCPCPAMALHDKEERPWDSISRHIPSEIAFIGLAGRGPTKSARPHPPRTKTRQNMRRRRASRERRPLACAAARNAAKELVLPRVSRPWAHVERAHFQRGRSHYRRRGRFSGARSHVFCHIVHAQAKTRMIHRLRGREALFSASGSYYGNYSMQPERWSNSVAMPARVQIPIKPSPEAT